MVLWIVIVGFLVGLALAFSIGANDFANSFGTSVGANILTLRNACILASVIETFGAVLIGSKAKGTILKGVIDIPAYDEDPALLELGYLSALIGSSCWLMIATVLKLPVSGTHSIVSAVIGFTLVAKGSTAVNWITLLKIISSWFVSPMLSGITSAAIYISIEFGIFRVSNSQRQIERAILALPVLYFITFSINSFSALFDAPQIIFFANGIPWWGVVLTGFTIGILGALLAKFFIGPNIERKSKKIVSKVDVSTSVTDLLEINTDDVERKNAMAVENEICDEAYGDDIQVVETKPHGSESIVNSQLQSSEEKQDNGEEDKVDDVEEDEKESMVEPRKQIVVDEIDRAEKQPLQPIIKQKKTVHFSTVTIENDSDCENNVLQIEPLMDKQYISFYGERDRTDKIDTADTVTECPLAMQVFVFLQILTGCFGAFSHGGNDVTNAVGPLVGLYHLYEGAKPSTLPATPLDMWIVAMGGGGISLGLWILGKRVVDTVGLQLTRIIPSSGFSMELGAAITIILANRLDVPISTTHCKVGSVVMVGIAKGGRSEIDWRTIRSIVAAWLITLPAAASISALAMFLFREFVYQTLVAEYLGSASTLSNSTSMLQTTTNSSFVTVF